mgnify:CR=1 FL=1
MGWLDKTLKNVARGARDFVKGPGGIIALSAAAPWLAGAAGPWAAKFGASSLGKSALGKFAMGAMKSPWVANALKNAAIQGGIASLTGSKHPWKAMGYSALASLPFTALSSVQAANKYNELFKGSEAFTELSKGDKAKLLAGDWKGAGFENNPLASWYDMALGNEMTPLNRLGNYIEGDLTGVRDLPNLEKLPEVAPTKGDIWSGPGKIIAGSGKPSPHAWDFTHEMIKEQLPIDLSPVSDIASSYFTRNPSSMMETVAGGKGLGSMIPALGLENIDLLATITPQLAGMYGGRMTDEERWLAAKEKQIRQWAFQFGIPYDEAKEIWKDGYRNPYYQTQTPSDYGDIMFANRGGHIYKDDYTAGGKAVGPGGPKDDAIRPVALSDDEFVFTAEASNNFPGGHAGLYALMNSLDPESERPEEARERIV